ncbi:biopolymer transporter ExbD, partial [Prevotella copri]|nr:biopolymer transporter ExbD [Segatella copri]
THADQRVDVNAEEKQGEENSTETATEQQKGGKQ